MKTILGGETSLKEGTPSERQGVFATHPGVTPKYDSRGLNAGGAESMARLFVPFPTKEAYDKYISSAPEEAKKILKVLSGVPAYQSGGAGGLGYVDFFLNNVTESFTEKISVSEVISDNYVAYFFGERAPTLTGSGALLNTRQDDWANAFNIVYHYGVRGTSLANKGAYAILRYGTKLAYGAMTSLTQTLVADNQNIVSFNFQFLIKRLLVIHESSRQPTKLTTDIIESTSPVLDSNSNVLIIPNENNKKIKGTVKKADSI